MIKPHASEKHIKALENDANVIRYKPTEIACAFGFEKELWPVTFEQVQDNIKNITN